MGWNLGNILSVAAAPFTGGLSLLGYKTGSGNHPLDYLTGAASAREQNEKQKQYQDETNQQSIDLANSAHQREIQDLIKAGLNPVLSAGGSGSATPNLGTAQVQNEMPGGYLAQATNVANIAGSVGSAKQALSQANLNDVNSEIQPAVAKADIASKFAQAGSAKAQADYTNVMKDVDKAQKEAETNLTEANTYRTKNLSKGEQSREWVKAIGGALLGVGGGAMGGMGAISSARSLMSPAYSGNRGIGFGY